MQTRIRGSANGASANKQSAKRTRDLFGNGDERTEHPSKRAALDVKEGERVRVTDEFASSWVSPTLISNQHHARCPTNCLNQAASVVLSHTTRHASSAAAISKVNNDQVITADNPATVHYHPPSEAEAVRDRDDARKQVSIKSIGQFKNSVTHHLDSTLRPPAIDR